MMEILSENKLVNGVELSIIDESKKIAGDRWFVKLCGRALVPWSGEMEELLQKAGGDLKHLKDSLGEIVFEIVRERNFISETEKQKTIDVMLSDIQENIVTYIEKPMFIEKLVEKRIIEWREACNREVLTDASQELNAEEDGPADFSDCFK